MPAVLPSETSVQVKVEAAWGANWKSSSSQTTWVDITKDTRGFSFFRGRTHELDTFAAGNGTVILSNASATYDPTSTGSVYSPNVLPGVPLRFSFIRNNATRVLWTGFVEDINLDYPGHKDATATLTARDGLKQLELAGVDTNITAQRSDLMIKDILDHVGWPSSTNYRTLGQGLSTLQAISNPSNTPALQLCRQIADSEGGGFFLATRRNAVRFAGRDLYALNTTSYGTFGETSTELSYMGLSLGLDDDQVFNDIVVSRIGASTNAEASDSTSINRYGKRTLIRSGLLLNSQAEAQSNAEYVLRRYKDPALRVRSITYTPLGSTGKWDAVNGIGLGQVIRVNRRPPGHATSISREVHVEGIGMSVSVEGDWSVRYDCSPVDQSKYWVLGTTGRSELGEATWLGW